MEVKINVNTEEIKKIPLSTSFQKALISLTETVSGRVKTKINKGSRSGNRYQTLISNSGKYYRIYDNFKSGRPIKVASARGENPKTDKGALVSSIRTNLNKIKSGLGVVLAGGTRIVTYAEDLENKLDRPIFKDEKVLQSDLAIFDRVLQRSLNK